MCFIATKTGKIGCQSIKSSNYQQLECPWSMPLCLLMFASPFIFALHLLLPLSDWTVSRGEPTSDCYLCVIRHCTAEPNNTPPLIRPTVRALPSWLYLIYVRFLIFHPPGPDIKSVVKATVFFAASSVTVPGCIQVWRGVTGAFPKHLNMWLVSSHHKFPTLFFHFR